MGEKVSLEMAELGELLSLDNDDDEEVQEG